MTMAPAARPISQPDVNQQGPVQNAPVPFRRATIERVEILAGEQQNLSAARVPIERTIEGTGYLYAIWLLMACVSTGNGATVANSEDAPWNAFDNVVLRDVNGEMVNLAGYDLYIANLACRQYSNRFTDQSTDTYVQSAPTTGAGATAGSFTAALRIPIGINRRDLTGLLGNQDRAQKYSLRTDFAATSSIWTTAPNGTMATSLTKIYENYGVPMPVTPNGQQQEIFPPTFGILHFITATLADAAPQGSTVVNHYLRRLGNTIRWIALIFRINGARSTVETAANNPTSIRMKIGDDTLFNETYSYRRALMFERYGFSFPNGVLLYDAMHDFAPDAGNELGDDYWHTQSVVNAQYQIAYPSGFGSTNNSLKIITDDLQRVGAPVR